MDAVPTRSFEISYHLTSPELVLLHAPDGRLIFPFPKSRLYKLNMMCLLSESTTTLLEAIADIVLRHKSNTYIETFTKERKLHTQQKHQP